MMDQMFAESIKAPSGGKVLLSACESREKSMQEPCQCADSTRKIPEKRKSHKLNLPFAFDFHCFLPSRAGGHGRGGESREKVIMRKKSRTKREPGC
jgi:hypothetical protein